VSQRDGFGGGFALGTMLGILAGGALGAVLATRARQHREIEETPFAAAAAPEPDELDAADSTRRSLEQKISQLNLAIDDVRQQLSTVRDPELEEPQA